MLSSRSTHDLSATRLDDLTHSRWATPNETSSPAVKRAGFRPLANGPLLVIDRVKKREKQSCYSEITFANRSEQRVIALAQITSDTRVLGSRGA
jgi:hypothetical protein